MRSHTSPVAPPPLPWVELTSLVLVAWAVFASIPLALGGIGLGWDALNHHIYLGWTAERPRFDRDFLAASYQAYQYPYLYWPLFKLFQSGINGAWAGVILVSFNVLLVPPLWMLARVCVREQTWYGFTMRWLAVVLSFLTAVVLSLFDATPNDLMASTPLVWAIAVGFQPWQRPDQSGLTLRRTTLLSGLLAGVSVAFKLSNGPLAILMPFLWFLPGTSLKQRVMNAVWGSLATVAGFVTFYGYWGGQLWVHYGNPVYPLYDNWFAPLRALLGWQP